MLQWIPPMICNGINFLYTTTNKSDLSYPYMLCCGVKSPILAKKNCLYLHPVYNFCKLLITHCCSQHGRTPRYRPHFVIAVTNCLLGGYKRRCVMVPFHLFQMSVHKISCRAACSLPASNNFQTLGISYSGHP